VLSVLTLDKQSKSLWVEADIGPIRSYLRGEFQRSAKEFWAIVDKICVGGICY
ncbi:uncharacterized protein METZ01_LOCUS214761, partial [marine metagenome]